MKAVAIAARRSLLGVPNTVVVRAGEALGYALVVLVGIGLGFWLLLSLLDLRPIPSAG